LIGVNGSDQIDLDESGAPVNVLGALSLPNDNLTVSVGDLSVVGEARTGTYDVARFDSQTVLQLVGSSGGTFPPFFRHIKFKC